MKTAQKGLLAAALLLTAGCSAQADFNVQTVEEMKAESLTDYSGTYVGDNSGVLAILQELPGGETVGELNLQGEQVNVRYKTDGEAGAYWSDEKERTAESFMYNALLLTLLVPNAQSYAFEAGDASFSADREELVRILKRQFADFPSENSIWDRESVGRFISANESALKEWAASEDKREEFFKEIKE